MEISVDPKPIGRGTTGSVVYKVSYNGNTVAGKRIGISLRSITDKDQELIDKEIEVSRRLDHENVIKFIGYEEYEGYPLLLMVYAEKGNLHEYIIDQKHTIENPLKLKWCLEIAKGLNYLHAHGVNHRDVKAQNILLTDALVCKVSDFGISKIRIENTVVSTQASGQINWFAPELFDRKPKIGRKSDVYAMGMTFWEIVTRSFQPFHGKQPGEIFFIVTSGEREVIPAEAPPKLKSAILKCWIQNSEERPFTDEIIKILEVTEE